MARFFGKFNTSKMSSVYHTVLLRKKIRIWLLRDTLSHIIHAERDKKKYSNNGNSNQGGISNPYKLEGVFAINRFIGNLKLKMALVVFLIF